LPTIFIADDNLALLETLVTMLADDFNILGTASCGQGVLDQAPKLHPDIILLDISLSDKTGFEVAKELKAAHCKSKFVFLSVHESKSFVDAARQLGAAGYVFKSQLSGDLERTLTAVYGGADFIASHRHPER
jgi:DNA-binding NarL/FixJ family response regulator